MNEKIIESAKIVIEKCVGLKDGETALIVYDDSTKEIADALFAAASARSKAVLMKIEPTGEDGKEPPKMVAEAMKKADVVITPTQYSLTHTDARRDASKKGARVATMPGVTVDMFTRTINVDYSSMEETINKIEKIFKKTGKVRVTSNSGTDITLNVKRRKRDLDTGIYTKKGAFGNLPAGEICLAPVKIKTDGVIVIDSMGDKCAPKTKVLVRKGLVKEVEGDDAFQKKLWSIKNARNLAELGIGVNPNARITGNILEDEKVNGTCHIAFGDNTSYPGGKTKSSIHWDGIIIAPTIWFDDDKIMDNGVLLL